MSIVFRSISIGRVRSTTPIWRRCDRLASRSSNWRGCQTIPMPCLLRTPRSYSMRLRLCCVQVRSRGRGECESVAGELAHYRPVVEVSAPATLDGGDIIVFGRRILVGATSRTNDGGIAALLDLVQPYGYSVEAVPVHGVLHLKSAATVVDDETLIHNPGQVDLGFLGARLLEAHPDEPQGANVVRMGEALLADASAPRTLELLSSHTDRIRTVDVDEFAKAEGAISCKGIIFET